MKPDFEPDSLGQVMADREPVIVDPACLPAFWAEHANGKCLDHVPGLYLMLALRYREWMPARLVWRIEEYAYRNGFGEEFEAWAAKRPTPGELAAAQIEEDE